MARGSVAALAATATAAASHTLAGADVPAPAILALAAAFAVVVCVFLSGRRLALPRLTASVLLSQLAYHALFLVAGSGGGVSVVDTSGGGAHVHDDSPVGLMTMGGAHAAHGPAMLVAHLVAAVLTIAMLRHGEQVFWTLGATLERIVVQIVAGGSALITPRSPTVAVVGAPEPRTPRTLDTVLSVLRHRGPPARAIRAL